VFTDIPGEYAASILTWQPSVWLHSITTTQKTTWNQHDICINFHSNQKRGFPFFLFLDLTLQQFRHRHCSLKAMSIMHCYRQHLHKCTDLRTINVLNACSPDVPGLATKRSIVAQLHTFSEMKKGEHLIAHSVMSVCQTTPC